ANYLEDARDGGRAYGDVRYLRLGNSPQHLALHDKLAAVTESEAALTFASGMAAISPTLLALLSAGDHLLIQDGVYGGTRTLLDDLARLGVRWTAIDAARPDTWSAALTPTTRAVYVEAISNPLMQVAALDEAAAFARANGL